jgi:hypothetical protein
MGALLQRVGLQRSPSQSLTQVPSANLIKSDNEFSPPEPEDIQFEMEPEKLEGYAQIADTCGFLKEVIIREKLLHFLKSKDFKVYDQSKVESFMARYIDHASKNLKLGNDLWWQWIGLKEYRHPLPHRVAENIKTIATSNENAVFFVSDIILVTSRNGWESQYKNTGSHMYKHVVIPMKRNTEICFLRVNLSADTLTEESLIIDAWRGPTFSDEEAKI